MRPHLELLSRLLVHVRRAVDRVARDRRRQRNRPRDLRAGASRRVDDLTRRLVEDPIVEGLEADPNLLVFHCARSTRADGASGPGNSPWPKCSSSAD